MEWKYRIHIKDQFEDNTTPELVDRLCKSLSKQLRTIISSVEKIGNYDRLLDDLEMIDSNFEFLSSLSSGEIKESEWDNYNFDGDYEDMFNDYLEQLYDLGDNRIEINGINYKFMWVG